MARATVEQIAREAKVSTATVTRVFQHLTNVRPETRDKVIEAARRLGTEYVRPIVGIVAPRTENPFMAELAFELQSSLAETYLPLIVTSEPNLPYLDGTGLVGLDMSPRSPDIFRSMNAAGIVHINADHQDPALLSELARIGLPMVVFGEAMTTGNADFVVVDSSMAMNDLVGELVDLGHRNFAFLDGDPMTLSARERHAAFADAIGRVGDRLPKTEGELRVTWYEGGYSRNAAYAVGKKLPLTGSGRTTAVVAANDEMAMMVRRAVYENGGTVPGDVSLIGYDNSALGDLVSPTLASMGPPLRLLAGTAKDLLDDRIAKTEVEAGIWPASKIQRVSAIYHHRAGNSIGRAPTAS